MTYRTDYLGNAIHDYSDDGSHPTRGNFVPSVGTTAFLGGATYERVTGTQHPSSGSVVLINRGKFWYGGVQYQRQGGFQSMEPPVTAADVHEPTFKYGLGDRVTVSDHFTNGKPMQGTIGAIRPYFEGTQTLHNYPYSVVVDGRDSPTGDDKGWATAEEMLSDPALKFPAGTKVTIVQGAHGHGHTGKTGVVEGPAKYGWDLKVRLDDGATVSFYNDEVEEYVAPLRYAEGTLLVVTDGAVYSDVPAGTVVTVTRDTHEGETYFEANTADGDWFMFAPEEVEPYAEPESLPLGTRIRIKRGVSLSDTWVGQTGTLVERPKDVTDPYDYFAALDSESADASPLALYADEVEAHTEPEPAPTHTHPEGLYAFERKFSDPVYVVIRHEAKPEQYAILYISDTTADGNVPINRNMDNIDALGYHLVTAFKA